MTPAPSSERQLAARVFGAAGLAVVLIFLIVGLIQFALGAITAIRTPYELDYGEGIVWQQMDAIVRGQGYAPLRTFPAIVFHYPPVYHWTVAALAAALPGIDPLAAGRLASILSTLASALLIGWLVRLLRAEPRGWPLAFGAAVAGGSFVLNPATASFGTVMRVDLLATALTLAGLVATIAAWRRAAVGHGHCYLAALLFTLAVYTKQTAIVAPAAAFAIWWLVRPAQAWRFALMTAAMGLGALAVLHVTTEGEFLRHVVVGNVNRFDPGRWSVITVVLATQAVSVMLTLIVGWQLVRGWGVEWRARIAGSPYAAAQALLVVYALLRVATLPLALKSGASVNYLIDLTSALAVLAGLAVVTAAEAVRQGRLRDTVLLPLVVLGMALQLSTASRPHDIADTPLFAERSEALIARMRAVPGPVLSDYMVLLRRAGHPVTVEPAIVAELAHAGRYDEAGLVRLLRQCRFSMIVLHNDPGIYHERYNPAVRTAIEEVYTRTTHYGGALVREPRAGGCGIATAGRGAAPPR